MVIENAVEGAIHSIIHIVHVREIPSLSLPWLFLVASLADHVHSNGVSGASKIPTYRTPQLVSLAMGTYRTPQLLSLAMAIPTYRTPQLVSLTMAIPTYRTPQLVSLTTAIPTYRTPQLVSLAMGTYRTPQLLSLAMAIPTYRTPVSITSNDNTNYRTPEYRYKTSSLEGLSGETEVHG